MLLRDPRAIRSDERHIPWHAAGDVGRVGASATDGRVELPVATVTALATALRSAADPALAIASDGRLLFANDAAAARWPHAAPGLRASELFTGAARAAFETGCAAVLSGGGAQRFDWGDEGPGGVVAWFACTLSPIADADPAGVPYLSSYVTEVKRSESRLRHREQLMVDTQGVAHLGTWEWDVSQPHASWSDELYRIYGLTPEGYTPSYE